jgi:RNA polymerase sigma-70 factor (ECF subfamily)
MHSRTLIANLYHSHFGLLRGFLEARTRCRETAAELAQETFIRMMGLSEPPQNPVGYAYQVARNLAVDHVRQDTICQYSECDEAMLEAIPDTQANAESIVYQGQRLRLIEAAIAELPPQCRRAFVLHRFGNMTQIEVSKELGISRQMVERHISKALAHLRIRMGEHADD